MLTITEDVARGALNIKDASHHYYECFQKKDLEGYVKNIRYDVAWTTCDKRHMPPYWRFLFHIIANYLSEQKGGFDTLKTKWVGVMACLMNKVEFNFSMWFFKCIQINVVSKNTWIMYPRSVQLILDDLMKNVPRPVYLEEVDDEGNVLPPPEP